MKLKRTNKLLALLLTLVMLVGLLPSVALASETCSFKVSANEEEANALFEYYYGDDEDCDIEYEGSDETAVDIEIDKAAIDSEHSKCPFCISVLLSEYDEEKYAFDHWTVNGEPADTASISGMEIRAQVLGLGQNCLYVDVEHGSDLIDLEIVAVFTSENSDSETLSFKVSASEEEANALFEYYYGDDEDCDIEYEGSDETAVDIEIDKAAIDSEHSKCPFCISVLLSEYDEEKYAFDHWTVNGEPADTASISGMEIRAQVLGLGQNCLYVDVEHGSDLVDLEIVAVFTKNGSDDPNFTASATVNNATMGSATATPNGTSYVLSATANSGYAFDHWEKDGASVSTANPYTVTPNENAIYTAVFVAVLPTPKTEDGALCISYQMMDADVQTSFENSTPYIGGRAALVLPFSMNTQVSKETSIHAVLKNGTASVTDRTCTVTSLNGDSTLYLIVPFDPLTADISSLAAAVTFSVGDTSLGTLEYTVPVTAAASAENSDFRYLTSPETDNYLAFIVDKGPTFRGFWADVDESTGALALYGYAKGYGDVDEGVFVFTGTGATDFVKVENPSEELLSHAPDGTAPADIEGAPATTGLQNVIRVVQDHNGDFYALTNGRHHQSLDSFGNEPYVGTDVFKWDKTNEKWVYQVIGDFNDPEDELDESQFRIRPDGVNRMDVVFDGVTVLYGDTPSGYGGYSGTGSVYLYTANRTISFQTNGGSDVTVLAAPIGSKISPPASPTREGYTFIGWYTRDNFMTNGPAYTWSVMPAKNLTLYAKWIEKSGGSSSDTFAAERKKAQASLDTALSRLTQSDYDASTWASIQSAYNTGTANIADAQDYDGIYAALNAALDAINELAQNVSGEMTVAVTVEKLTVNGSYIIEPTLVTVDRGSLASVVVTDLLKAHYPSYSGKPYTMTGTETSNFYLSGVWDGTTMLSEFDHGIQSGWMYCVNGSFPGVGASGWILKNGDVMRWQYTCEGLGADIGNNNEAFGGSAGVPVADKDALIWKIAEINEAGTQSTYGNDYTNAMTVLKTIEAPQADVNAALAALNKQDGGNASTGGSSSGSSSGGTTSDSSTVTADDGSQVTTETEKTVETKENDDGSVTEVVTETTKTTVTTPDGSVSTTETAVETETTTNSVKNPDGTVTETEQTVEKVTETVTGADGKVQTTVTETEETKELNTTTGADGKVSGTGTYSAKSTVTVDGKATTAVTEGTVAVSTDDKGTVSEVTTAKTTTTAPDGTKTETVTVITEAEMANGTTGKVVADEQGNTLSAEASVSQAALEAAVKSGEPIEIPVTVNAASGATVSISLEGAGEGSKLWVEIGTTETAPGNVAYLKLAEGVTKLLTTCKTGSVIVPVTGDCEVIVKDNSKSFTDVDGAAWYGESVKFVTAREIFNGTGNGMFAPAATMNRAMAAQILYNLDGSAKAGDGTSFSDVKADDWFNGAVGWASGLGVITGYDGAYSPLNAVTRQDLVTILYRYAKQAGYNVSAGSVDLTRYADGAEVASYAAEAMRWAIAVGLVKGYEDNTLRPTATATRAEVAAIMQRLVQSAVK